MHNMKPALRHYMSDTALQYYRHSVTVLKTQRYSIIDTVVQYYKHNVTVLVIVDTTAAPALYIVGQ